MPVVNGEWVLPDKALSLTRGHLPPPVRGMHAGTWRTRDIEKLTDTPFWQMTIMKGMAMDIEAIATETSGAAEESLRSLKLALDKFKSTLANDLTAIKSASARVQSEAVQMKQSYSAAQEMLTTAQFERAVLNAERMAAALTAISELSETKLSVAVFSGGSRQDEKANVELTGAAARTGEK